ncbi:MAG: hypothetical protein WBV82_01045 [Myxococcaceae bacterium]
MSDVNPASQPSELDYQAAPVLRTEHAEGGFTRLIEQQAARIPSDVFLFISLSSMVASLALEITGRRRFSRFVGMWPGPLLVMGVYNKLVKTLGPR